MIVNLPVNVLLLLKMIRVFVGYPQLIKLRYRADVSVGIAVCS